MKDIYHCSVSVVMVVSVVLASMGSGLSEALLGEGSLVASISWGSCSSWLVVVMVVVVSVVVVLSQFSSHSLGNWS